jgi:hypothetical protein
MKTQGWQRAALIAVGSGTILFVVLPRGQGYLTDPGTLAALLVLELILAAVWSFRSRFFLALLGSFVWAGIGLPFNMAWTTGRWFVLAIGALVGAVVYLKDRQLHLTAFHLVAFICSGTALVSAAVSAYPRVALFKSLSLLLLFLYAATGARMGALGREGEFLCSFTMCCEGMVYIAAIAYFGFHYRLLGNPNSLGAVMGVVAVPLFLWGILASEDRARRLRFTVAAVVALLLLFSSYARAGIMGAAFSSLLLCLTLRRYRMLAKGICLALLLAVIAAALMPRPNQRSESLTSTFLYKGKREQGLLGSRRSVWDETVAVIQGHPWLGVGFGTSETGDEESPVQPATFHSEAPATREHGNSYLAITEWVGLLGDVPFLFLLLLTVTKLGRVLAALRRSGSAASPAVPIAMVLAAGLVHAAFEDWLFAVGYYLCVLFWSFAFILVDLAPRPVASEAAAHGVPSPWPGYPQSLSPAHHAPVS